MKAPTNAITDELIALDARRDEAINGIIALATGYTYNKGAAIKNAAGPDKPAS